MSFELSDSFLQATAPRVAALGGSILSSLALAAVAEKGIRALRTRSKIPLRSMAENMGAPKGLVFSAGGPSGTAHFVPGEVLGVANNVRRLFGAEPDRAMERRARYGEVSFSKDMDKPGIIAHELGHAVIGNRPWTSPSRINQSLLRPVTTFVSPAVSMLGSLMLGSEIGRRPVPGGKWGAAAAGGLAGGALGLLAGAPTLVNEWQASSLADKWMENESNLTDADRIKSRAALNKAFATYVAASAVAPALAAGVSAYLARK